MREVERGRDERKGSREGYELRERESARSRAHPPFRLPSNGSEEVVFVSIADNLRIGDEENPEMPIVRRCHGFSQIWPS